MFSFQGACLSFLFKRLNEISNCFGISVNLLVEVVGQNGLEPSTSRLSVVCSSQLSYWPISAHFFWWRLAGSNRWPPACKAGALPAELNPHIFHQFLKFHSIIVNCQLSIVNYFRLYPLNWITQKLQHFVLTLGRYKKKSSFSLKSP